MEEEAMETLAPCNLARPDVQEAAARSRLYAVFVELFEYPDAERVEDVRSGEIARALAEAMGAVHPELAARLDGAALRAAGEDEDDLAVEFTRLFDVGTGGPPCPLYGGLYGGARMKTMEEAVRFYNHFGLTLSERPRELPDHLSTELEFLHFLAFREADALSKGSDPGPYRRSARDFIVRHPGRFAPKLRERLEHHQALPFFRELVARLEDFLAWDAARLEQVVGPLPAAQAPDAPSSGQLGEAIRRGVARPAAG
jgi:putative dimethyl sulfoxide reductase chaperone